MNLSYFLLISVIIFIQSNDCESSRNETMRDDEKKPNWVPYRCLMEKFSGKKVLYFFVHSDHLYFMFDEFALRIRHVRIEKNFLRRRLEFDRGNFFLTYEEPQYLNYNELTFRPEILRKNITAYFHLIWPDKMETYAYSTQNSKSNAYQVILNDLNAG